MSFPKKYDLVVGSGVYKNRVTNCCAVDPSLDRWSIAGDVPGSGRGEGGQCEGEDQKERRGPHMALARHRSITFDRAT